MMRTIISIAVLLLIGLTVYFSGGRQPRIRCFDGATRALTISIVKYGRFVEYIPQTGKVKRDSLTDSLIVKVKVDQLYFRDISVGLTATSYLNNVEENLIITHVDSVVNDGRFNLEMMFRSRPSSIIRDGQDLRLRIALGEPRDALLLPVGGFYKDTGGEWIYTVDIENRLTRKEIKLGKRNSEHFEVLAGLKAGDTILTSTYDRFEGQESPDLDDFDLETILY